MQMEFVCAKIQVKSLIKPDRTFVTHTHTPYIPLFFSDFVLEYPLQNFHLTEKGGYNFRLLRKNGLIKLHFSYFTVCRN